ncbi:MAG TPA: FMN-binding glutamate synthase family protein, partial [Janthinobacterium sp.]|nr:FMN-binding glutamate synthase family protein [Janthinobacterium sp.]
MRLFSIRYLAFYTVAAVCALSLALADGYWLALLSGALTLVGIVDLLQSRRALRRNYPILAHFRFMLESVRPEIRQYFLEN